MGSPTSGQSVVSQAYQSLFDNIDGKMWFNFFFIGIYHSFSSSKNSISLLDYPPPHGGAPPEYGGVPPEYGGAPLEYGGQ
jgi:hypothetical protein